ncbi:MAG: hypothetical protein H6559_02925 [Lewinellaceae bacterium]|nr:hypothetical protein [Lewinellaceae bacterium]
MNGITEEAGLMVESILCPNSMGRAWALAKAGSNKKQKNTQDSFFCRKVLMAIGFKVR